MRSRIAAALAALAIGVACAPAPAAADSTTTLTALVASNATGAFKALIAGFEKTHPGVKINATYGGGQALQTQIESGAKVDIALLGNPVFDKITDLVDPPTPILTNRETILVPKGNPAKIGSLEDLAKPGVRVVIGTEDSAVGKLARSVLVKAAGKDGSDFPARVRKNVAVEATSGAGVVDAVLGGKADAAIAFVADADPAKFTAIPIPPDVNVATVYSLSSTKNAEHAKLAREFIAMVASKAGQAVLHSFRYDPPSK